jgi:UDP-2-acetamido-3-amino-2,3-dideoxy-glucuronate N-acetyltransferase
MEIRSSTIHPTVDVSPNAKIGPGTRIWNLVRERGEAEIGQNCLLGKDVYVDFGVKIGDNVKIQMAGSH